MATRYPMLLAFVLLLATAVGAGAESGEFTVVGAQVSGDYDDDDLDTQSATLRFRIGSKTQFFADLDWRRVRTGVIASPLGPLPARQRDRRQPDSGAQSGDGPGPGPGNSAASQPAAIPPDSLLPAGWNNGLGDLRLNVSREILGGGAKRFRLDTEVGVKVPTGESDKNLGTGEVDYRLGLAGNYRFWSMTSFAGLGWNALGDPDWTELANVFDAYWGAETEPLRDRVVLSGWLEGNQEVVAGNGSRLALGIGARSTGKLRWRTQLTVGLSGSAETFSTRVGFSFGNPTAAIGSDRMH